MNIQEQDLMKNQNELAMIEGTKAENDNREMTNFQNSSTVVIFWNRWT